MFGAGAPLMKAGVKDIERARLRHISHRLCFYGITIDTPRMTPEHKHTAAIQDEPYIIPPRQCRAFAFRWVRMGDIQTIIKPPRVMSMELSHSAAYALDIRIFHRTNTL
ncbi:hypothetical protein D3C86_1435010 [compost metagenome]